MSHTIEQKVVEMRFDNSNFERNVSQSMSTLNKLQNAIDKTSSGNAFAGLSKAVDNLNFGSVSSAIQTVTEKFSIWEEIAIGAARNIGAALSNYVVNGLNNMVFSNVSAGWDKYAQKTEAVQTIMASLADQDFGNIDKMEYVSDILEKLNWFTDETSFHFTDMVSSIGKFTSAGVDLEKASDAMMGIATWAAVSGANADTASRVMYQLSQSLGMGSVRAQDWMSVETANMATKEFKELAIQVAKTQKTINGSGKAANGGKNAQVVTFQNFRETLKDGWLTSNVLTETLGQYSSAVELLNRTYYALGENVPTSRILPVLEEAFKKAGESGKKVEDVFSELVEREWGEELEEELDFSILDENGKVIGNLADKVTELGLRAFRAAQEAKTFAEAMGSVGDAASTIWMNIWEKLFGDYETAKVLWTDLANYLYDIFVAPLWDVYDIIDDFVDLGGRDILFGRDTTKSVEEATGAFYIMMETVKNVQSAFMNAFGDVFSFGGQNLINFSNKILAFAKRTKVTKDNVEELTGKFKKFFSGIKEIIDSIDIFNKHSETSVNVLGQVKQRFEDTFTRVENVLSGVKSLIGFVKDGIVGFFNALKVNGIAVQNFGDAAENLGEIGNDLADAFKPITSIFGKFVEYAKKAGEFISTLIGVLSSVVKSITDVFRSTNLLSKGAEALNNILDAVKEGFESAFDSAIFADIEEMFEEIWTAITTFITGFMEEFDVLDKVKAIAKGVGSAINLIGRAVKFLLTPLKTLAGLGVFEEIGKFVSGTVLNILLSIPSAIGKIISKLDAFIAQHPQIQETWKGIATVFSSLVMFIFRAINSVSAFIKSANPLSKVGELVSNIFNKFKESEKLGKIGEKISGGFEKVVDFFRDDFIFEKFGEMIDKAKAKIKAFVEESETIKNVKEWFDNLTGSIKKFIDESEFLANVKKSLQELWSNIKKLFSNQDDFEGFGSDFMAGFGKGMLKSVNYVVDKAKEIGAKILGAIKDFFGIHSPSTVMEEVGKNLVNGFTKGIRETIKGPVDAIKKIGVSLYNGLVSLLFGKGKGNDVEKAEEDAKNASDAMSNIKASLANFGKKLLGIGAISLPAIAITKLINGINSLMSPFSALRKALELAKLKVVFEGVSNGISALGGAIKNVLLSLGGFVIMIAAAVAIIAVVDKYTGGKTAEAIKGLQIIIGEVVGAITTIVGLVAFSGKSTAIANGDLASKTGSLAINSNKTAEYMEAIGKIFLQIGASMLLFAGAVAGLAFMMKDEKSTKAVENAFNMMMSFLALMGVAAYFIMEFSEGTTESSVKINKKGINLNHQGFTEGLYAVGAFMLAVGTAMLGLAAAAAIVVKSTGGDIDKMNAAFEGMIKMLAITMGAIVIIASIQEFSKKSKGFSSKSNSGIRDAAIALASMALGIKTIAKVVIMLGKENPTAIKQGTETVMKIGLVIAAFAFIAANANSSTLKSAQGLGAMFRNMAISFVMIGLVVKVLGGMDPGKLSRGVNAAVSLGLLFGVIGSIMILAAGVKNNNSEKKINAIGKIFLALSGAFVIMAVALNIIGNIENVGGAIAGLVMSFVALGALFAEIALITKTGSGVKIDKLVGLSSAFAIIAGALAVMAIALKITGSIENIGGAIAGMAIAFVALGALFAEIALLTKTGSGVKIDKLVGLSSSIVIIAGAFVLMAHAMTLMGKLTNMGQVIAGLIVSFASLGVLFGMISLFADSSKKVENMLKAAGALAIVALSIGVVLTILADAGTVFAQNEGALGQGVIALAAAVIALGAIAAIAMVAGPAMLTFGLGLAAFGAGVLLISAGLFVFYSTLMLIVGAIDVFGDGFLELGNVLLDNFIALMPKLGKLMSEFFKAIANGIADSAIEIVNAVVKVIKEIGKNIDVILGILGPLLDKLIVFVVEKVTLLVTLLQPLIENIINHIIYLATELLVPALLNSLQTVIDFILINIPIIAGVIVSTVEMIVTRVLMLIDTLINSEIGLLAIIRRALMGENGVLTIIEEFLHALLASLRNLVTDLIDTLVYILQELVDGIINNIDIILTGIEDTINMVVDHLVSLTDTILEGIVKIIEGIATSIENHGADIFTAIFHVVEAIIGALTGFLFGSSDDPNSIAHVAKEMMSGLGKGIINFVGEAINGIIDIGSKIVGKFKEVFGIKSPSTVMAEIGGYLDSGLAKGITDNTKPVFSGINGLGDGIIDSLKSKFLGDEASDITGLFGDNVSSGLTDALGGITDVLDTDDFTPTITPVLDLSEIQNGASQIPGMINSGSGYTVDTTAVVNSSYNPYEYYDGTERLSQSEAQLGYFEMLEAKMNEVVNKFANAKVVLDTGAVVGGIVDPMDMALGQRMAQVGRGVISSTR